MRTNWALPTLQIEKTTLGVGPIDGHLARWAWNQPPGCHSTGCFVCSPLLPRLPPPHGPSVSQPFILAAGDMALSKTRPLLSRAEFLARRQSVDESPNWHGRPLQEIEFLVSVQALGARAVWGQSGSGLIVDWPLLVTDLPFL